MLRQTVKRTMDVPWRLKILGRASSRLQCPIHVTMIYKHPAIKVVVERKVRECSPGYLPLPARTGLMSRRSRCYPTPLVGRGKRRWPADFTGTTCEKSCIGDAQLADTTTAISCDMELGPKEGADTQQLTQFIDEEVCQAIVRSGGKDHVEQYVDDSVVSNVKSYLSRPQLIQSGAYAADSPQILFSRDISTQFWTQHAHYSKVLGAYGMRATTCFKLVVAATPYHSGILRMCFSPFDMEFGSRSFNATQFSQMPGVDLNLSDSTSCEFRVPFIHYYNYFMVNNLSGGTLGKIFLTAYTPMLVAPGGSSVPYTLYWWLEDVELIGAFPATVSGTYVAAQQFILDEIRPRIVDQSLAITAREQKVKPASFSAILSSGASAAKYVGKLIPSLSMYTGPTAWFMRQASGVAASFGWAKPQQTDAITRMRRTYGNYHHNIDGFDTSYNMGATVDTQLAPTMFGGTDIDEMSIGYLTSIYSRISMRTIQTTQPQDSIIFHTELRPYDLVDNDSALAFRSVSTLAMLQNCFLYWRGGLKFRFKMAKTKFHTGRLIIGYIPRNAAGDLVPSAATTMDYKSVVWDLRQSDYIEFECPFIVPTAYLPYNISAGQLFVKVLDPLVAPDVVSGTVAMVVEVAGGEDIEFAGLVNVRSFATAFNGTSYHPPELARAPRIVDQSMLTQAKTSHCEQAIGNRILSLKSIFSRGRCADFTLGAGQTAHVDYMSDVAQQGGDYHSLFLDCYGLWRGGWKLSAYVPPNQLVRATFTPQGVAEGVANDSMVIEDGALHVTVPYYKSISRSPVMPSATLGVITLEPLDNSGSVPFRVQKSFADDFQLAYFRCCPAMKYVPL